METVRAEDIDFVLVYESDYSRPTIFQSLHVHQTTSSETITQFLKAVAKLGLELVTEVDDVYEATTKTYKKVNYVKAHATNAFLTERAEMARLRVPFKEVDVHEISITSPASYLLRLVSREVTEERRLSRSYYYKVRFLRQLLPLYRAEGWVLDVSGSLFSQTQRLELVWSALESLTLPVVGAFGKVKSITMRDLLDSGELNSVFPIHDSDLNDAENVYPETSRLRTSLHKSWASFKQWRILQPLDDIYSYFGTRVGLYFAWLGFYTKALCVPAILGVVATIYSVREYFNPDLDDYCDLDKAGHFTNCPLGEVEGKFTYIPRLYESCAYMKLTAMFDNGFTIAYGFVVCLWSSLFLEGWKRRQAELVNRWGSDNEGVDESRVRSQFINRYMKEGFTKDKGANLKTLSDELDGDVHSATRLWSLSAISGPRYAFKIIVSIALFVVLVVFTIALAAGSTFLRVFISDRLKRIVLIAEYSEEETLSDKVLDVVSPSLCASVVVSIINAVVMLILAEFYTWVARRMADFECLRTEREYEKSFIYKIFVFQFVNYFIGIFYTAFIKQWIAKQLRLSEQCPSVGCVADVCIQILIVMSLKQLYGHAVELLSPILKKRSKRLINNIMERGRKKHDDDITQRLTTDAQWKNDYKLNDNQEPLLYSEYLEMCIQYAFVILFATAFPPASILALVNNVFEIRIDAKKCIQHFKRPIPIPARDIGPWFAVLQFITKAAVFTNALIIAFGGSFIDRLVFHVYQYKQYNTADITNSTMSMLYINHIYSQIKFKDLVYYYYGKEAEQINMQGATAAWTKRFGSPYCYARDYVELVPNNDDSGFYEWNETRTWWHVFAAKLVFIIVFEKVVTWLQTLIAGLVPDIPDHVRIQQEREEYLEQQTFLEANRQIVKIADQGIKAD